ncbi:MAG: PDZ domain-containing protein, partial [Bacteroidales bacterium]|nr:PDZ domain-containing protein [Bacteroidales bacterium]
MNKHDKRLSPNSADGNWAKLMLVLNTVDANYMDKIDYADVTEDLLPKIMSELDPHSIYLPPEELKEAEASLQGNFDGIGIQFNVPNDTAIVTNVISGGPSERAGLMSGDRIITVDDITIAGVKFPQDSMVAHIKGPRGSEVKIGIMRGGEPKLIYFNITRDKILDKSVDVAYMINDTTGYIKLSKFTRNSYSEFHKGVMSLAEQGMKRLIFDLRDNTGGYLDQAMLISNEFLKRGEMVVYMEGLHRARQTLTADGRGRFQDIPLAVLINESSASSSEIVAGAIQDNDRGTIYGVRSFGKGLVQEQVYFSDGSGIRLTVSRYYTPTGRCIQKPFDTYESDIMDRYYSGEFFSADSIKVNDSLKYVTPGGRTVYGGGGIVPDVFVPLDTVGVNSFYVKCNRLGLQSRFAVSFADSHRQRLAQVKALPQLYKIFEEVDVEKAFLDYARTSGAIPAAGEWEASSIYILAQCKALIGRYTPLGDDAFYPIYHS